MRPRFWLFAMSCVLSLAALLSVPVPASAQHIADNAVLEQAMTTAAQTDAENRSVVLEALGREDVRAMAERFGVDVKTAATAVGSLSGSELAELAAPARALTMEQAGGQTTVVISLTTLLLIIIIVILIAN